MGNVTVYQGYKILRKLGCIAILGASMIMTASLSEGFPRLESVTKAGGFHRYNQRLRARGRQQLCFELKMFELPQQCLPKSRHTKIYTTPSFNPSIWRELRSTVSDPTTIVMALLIQMLLKPPTYKPQMIYIWLVQYPIYRNKWLPN